MIQAKIGLHFTFELDPDPEMDLNLGVDLDLDPRWIWIHVISIPSLLDVILDPDPDPAKNGIVTPLVERSESRLRRRSYIHMYALRVAVPTVILGPIKRLCGRGGFTVLLPYNTCTGLFFPKKEAAAL